MTRRPPQPRPPRLTLEDLTTQEMVMIKICEFTAGRAGRCACFYEQRRHPSCATLEECAAKIVADVRLFDARQKDNTHG